MARFRRQQLQSAYDALVHGRLVPQKAVCYAHGRGRVGRTSTLRNGRRSTDRDARSGRIDLAGGMEVASGCAALPSRSPFFSSLGGPRTGLVEAVASLSPAGVALRGRPRAFFGAMTCSSATGVTLRGRPGLRRTGAASAASGSVPAGSAPTEPLLLRPAPDAGSWQRGAARARRRRSRPRRGRRCSGRVLVAVGPEGPANRHSEASRWA